MPPLHARALALCLFLAIGGCTPAVEAPPAAAPAPSYPVVGGAPMYPNRTIAQNIGASADHKILSGALQASGVATTLAGAGPFTLFAPTDAAFRQLPNGIVEALMHPRSRSELTGVVNTHVVVGAKTRAQMMADIQSGGGQAFYRTAAGGTLRVTMEAGRIVLTDPNGRRASVTQADVSQSNGVMHVVDAVLLPAN